MVVLGSRWDSSGWFLGILGIGIWAVGRGFAPAQETQAETSLRQSFVRRADPGKEAPLG